MSICDTCSHYPCSGNRKKIWGSCPAYMLKSTPAKTMYDRLVSMTPNEMALWFAKTFGDEGDYNMWMKFLCASADKEGEG